MIKHYFVCANTSKGFQNFFASNLKGLKKIYILKGGPGTGKSTLMKNVGAYYEMLDYDIEFIHCSSDVESLDGVIIRKMGVAIVDGTAPHVIEPTAPGALEEYVHLGIAWDISQLEANLETIKKLQSQIQECYVNVYKAFEDALEVHDEWERIYISEMDFSKANHLTEEVKQLLIGDYVGNGTGEEVHRFFGATTPIGPTDFIENLTQDLEKRYFIKGRPGTGKSSMLKKIVLCAKEHKLDVEIYHCAFDPDSLDMLIIPELNLCIFDSTAPHEYFPSTKRDEIIDVYENCVAKGTDEKYQSELNKMQQEYKLCIKIARDSLGKAKSLHDKLEQFYIKATDFTKINEVRDDLLRQMKKFEIS